MEQMILILHVLAALAIIGLIMIQQGKGADMGASFGAGASQTLFGSSGGGNILTSSTSWLVALFFATSFGLAVIAKNQSVAVDVIDVPAMVESQSASEIPVIDEAAITQGLSDDVPVIDAPAAASDSDIPEI